MTDEEFYKTLLNLLNSRAKVRILQGTFVAASSTGYTVDINGSRIPVGVGSSYLPEVNEVVEILNVGRLYLLLGPAGPKPDRGTVTSVASGLVTMTTFLPDPVTCPYVGTVPSAGQTMKILWHGGPIAFLMSTSPPPQSAPPAPTPTAQSHTDTFTALDSGSYGSRWWTNQVYASDSNLGAWFYGSKINDTIPAGSPIQKVEVFVPGATQISGSAPNFALHGYQTKPGGAPTLSTVSAVGIIPGWVTLPSSIGDALKAGGGSWGIGVNHGGYNIFPSLAQDSMSGALRITSTY